MTSNNLDFTARCMIGHNTKDIKSLISEVENIQNDIGGVKIVQITKEDYDALTDKPTNVIYLVSNGDKITLYIGSGRVGTSTSGAAVSVLQNPIRSILAIKEE